MNDVINLRTARKRAKRAEKDRAAQSHRVSHGTPKALRDREQAIRHKAARNLEGHRRTDGDGE